MNSLVQSWGASLKMLTPENLVPLLKVALKTSLEVYRLLLTYFWWLIGLGLALALWPARSVDAYFFGLIFGLCLLTAWVWTLLLAARPSVELKNITYFIRYMVYLIVPLLLLRAIVHMQWSVISVIAPYFTLIFFFMLDAHFDILEIIRVPWYALKMSVSLLPVYGLISLLLYSITKVIFLYDHSITALVWVLLVLPLFIVLMSRLYIISLHKNYKDYYEHCR